ncbi:MAG: hypothetical protein ACLQLG_08220 [Thermoguttaceae bacterium]
MTKGSNMGKGLKTALFTSLHPELAKHGFALKATKDRFVRRHGDVTDFFQLVCLNAKPGYRIQPNTGVRIERVEELFHQSSGFDPKHRKHTATMGNSVGILLNGRSRTCEFLLESESEVGPVAEKIMDVFREFALPYFERWGSLKAIDVELNDTPTKPTPHRGLAWFRCSTGIIVARLLGRPDYEQLVAFYTDVMARDNKGFYLGPFQALLKSLENVEPGSGLSR